MRVLECTQEAIDLDGKKIMHFTKGKAYFAEESIDLPGWKVEDDNGRDQIFFDLSIIFKVI